MGEEKFLESGSDAEAKIADLSGVRGGDDGFPVQLWHNEDGRIVVRSVNEGGFACADVDLFDLLNWLDRMMAGRGSIDVGSIRAALSAGVDFK